MEYPVTPGVETGRQGGTQHGGQGDGGNLRDLLAEFDEIRGKRESCRDVPQLLARAVVTLRRDHHAEPEMAGERRDDRGTDEDLSSEAFRDSVAQRREGVRGDEEADLRRARGGGPSGDP
jgi:hypothetical protein